MTKQLFVYSAVFVVSFCIARSAVINNDYGKVGQTLFSLQNNSISVSIANLSKLSIVNSKAKQIWLREFMHGTKVKYI